MIVDCHAHVFPFLGSPAGYGSAAEHLRWLQLYVVGHSQPVRRLRDHAVVVAETLADHPLDRPSRLWDVGFHVAENGRFVWRRGGEELYIHFMPPSLQTNACPPELLLAQMAYVGVEVAVLQNARPYGRLDEYFAAAAARYPGKLVGLAAVDEPRADSPAELQRLRVAVRTLGLRGLYYANRRFLTDVDPSADPATPAGAGYRHAFDDPRYEPLWETVRELGIPVFWELFGVPEHDESSFLRELDRLDRWMARHPAVPCVLTHGLPPSLLAGSLPEPLTRLLAREQLWVEVLYPIGWGRAHDYPWPELRPAIRELYRLVGGSRLLWGSDMPNVERSCTYRQSLDYLRHYCDFIPAGDLERILGANVAALLGLG